MATIGLVNKMGQTAEMLRHDLRAVQNALGEILSCVQPQVPSWRFPERLAAGLELEDVLSSKDESSESNRVLLLEVIVDRFVLLLQSSLKLWSDAEDHSSHPLPLTLSSAVKKYCKKLIKNASTTQQLRDQLAAKDEVISSLSCSVSQLREDCQLLQDILPHSTLAGQSRPTSVLASGRSVPYEARGTLKINRFPQQLSAHHRDGEHIHTLHTSHSTPLISSSPPPTTALHTHVDKPLPPKRSSVSTQTMETSFALCVQCSATQATLASVAGKIAAFNQELQLPTQMSETDWTHEAESGGLELGRWEEALTADLAVIGSHCKTLLDKSEHLQEELNQQKRLESELQLKLCQLSSEMELIQLNIVNIEKRHAEELSWCQESVSQQLKELTAAHSLLRERSGQLEEELNTAQQEKAELKLLLSEIDGQLSTLQSELCEVCGREQTLLSSQAALQQQLENLRLELGHSREELEAEQLELNKTTTLSRTLEKKNKAILSKQTKLLQRLEELDKEAESLRREVSESARVRDDLATQLQHVQAECSTLHSQLSEQKAKAVESAQEQQRLSEELMSVETRLASLSSQLEAEKENCRLLAGHPFIPQGSDSYQTYLASLSSKQSQRQISANTIRILLLEEQNSDLRGKVLQEVREEPARRRLKVRQPTQQEKNTKPSTVHSAVLTRAARSTSTHPQAPASADNPPPRPPSTPREHLRGRLGHLVSAIAAAQRNGSREGLDSTTPGSGPHHEDWRATPTSCGPSPPSSCSSMHMWTCAACDRMFPGQPQLHEHQITCPDPHQ